jgi:hypothetical protein
MGIGDIAMSEDRYNEYLGIALDAGWNACADCGKWQPVTGMVEVDGWLYCPEHRPDEPHANAAEHQPLSPTLSRADIIARLTAFRLDWDGEGNLCEIELPFGLLLFDIAVVLGLTREERRAVLGEQLCHDLAERIGP